jgi:hypothetical protein
MDEVLGIPNLRSGETPGDGPTSGGRCGCSSTHAALEATRDASCRRSSSLPPTFLDRKSPRSWQLTAGTSYHRQPSRSFVFPRARGVRAADFACPTSAVERRRHRREAARRLGIADQPAQVIPEARDADRVVHPLPDILRLTASLVAAAITVTALLARSASGVFTESDGCRADYRSIGGSPLTGDRWFESISLQR